MGNCMEKHPVDSHDKLFRGGNVQLISGKGQWDDIISKAEDNKLVIANFSATWCSPCITMAPFYMELSAHHPSVVFLSIDVDDNEELSTLWEIQATPTFIFLKNGQKMDVHMGANKADLERKLIKFIDSSAVGSTGPSSSPCFDTVPPEQRIMGTPPVSSC